ncbi:MAG TPA: alpha/beta hydrolase [Acidimicrobiales bacterium]|nr:alpha/beta hydrolase [Acidimicrobiales bacterium]
MRTIELGADATGPLAATLVRHDAGAAAHERALLHVHGFNDYFFHLHLADAFAARGWAVYGLDLRRCGRSRASGQPRHFTTDLAEYDAELDEAVRILRDDEDRSAVVVEAHSTGGLIAPLWLDRRQGRSRVDGLVLNSPWFEFAGTRRQRLVADVAGETIGRIRPLAELPSPPIDAYGASIHSSRAGEWDFDLELKPLLSPVYAGWLRAVRRGQRRLHRGLGVDVPTLVLRSSRSIAASATWSDDYLRADTVLDVAHMSRYAGCVGPRVTVDVIDGALHDLYLSDHAVRTGAIDRTVEWLDRTVPGR